MGSKVAAWMCAWTVLSVVAGCGKAEGGADPIPLSELPTRSANMICDSLAGCCKSSGVPMDSAACKTYYRVGLQEDYGHVDLQRLRYDPEAAGACLFAISSKIQCGQVDADEPPVCERIFTGRIALGQPCDGRQACADVAGQAVFCESPDGSSPTVCIARANGTLAHGKAGDTCSYTCYEDQTCDDADAPGPQPGVGDMPAPQPQPHPLVCHRNDGLFCDAGLCAPLVAAGAPCGASDACHGTAFCNSMTGLCTTPQPDGSPCETNEQCLSGSCTQAPESAAEPDLTPPHVCSSAAAVTAAWCRRDFSSSPTDSTSPDPASTDPGTNAGAP